jgi:hypothetical protein
LRRSGSGSRGANCLVIPSRNEPAASIRRRQIAKRTQFLGTPSCVFAAVRSPTPAWLAAGAYVRDRPVRSWPRKGASAGVRRSESCRTNPNFLRWIKNASKRFENSRKRLWTPDQIDLAQAIAIADAELDLRRARAVSNGLLASLPGAEELFDSGAIPTTSSNDLAVGVPQLKRIARYVRRLQVKRERLVRSWLLERHIGSFAGK